MNWQPSKQILEDAALAGGRAIYDYENGGTLWQPHLPTIQGKADLLDLMLATSVSWEDGTDYMYADRFGDFPKKVKITNGDKHAALMEAALEVAAQVGAKMKGTPC